MEADDPQATAGMEDVPCQRKRLVERAELVVHDDPDRLKDPLCRVATAELTLNGCRNSGTNCIDQLGRPFQRGPFAPPDDLAGDLVSEALVPVALERVRETTLVPDIENL